MSSMDVAVKSGKYITPKPSRRESSMDELVNGMSLCSGKYVISEFMSLNNLGIKYHAKCPAGISYIIKELYISDICRREGMDVVHMTAEDEKEFQSLVKAFMVDLESLAKLESLNIGKICQFFEENNTIYVVVEKPDGVSLYDRLTASDQKLSPDQITEMLIKLLKALNQIHGLGVLHRDIEPKNIIVTPDSEPVLFIDFSTFRNSESKETRTVSKIVASDNPYTSLEMNVSPENQSPASDIYSLAASFYFAIKDTPPTSIMQRVSAVANEEKDPYEPLAGIIDGYGRGVLETIDMSLSVFSESRINSTIEWLMHLSHLLEDSDKLNFKPVMTPPKEITRKLHFPVRTALLGLMASGMCLFLIGLIQYIVM